MMSSRERSSTPLLDPMARSLGRKVCFRREQLEIACLTMILRHSTLRVVARL